MQTSIIKKSEIDKAKRFDAEYFKPEYLEVDFSLEHIGYYILSEIADVKGGKRLPLGESFSKEGIPYIRAEDIKNNFVDYENVPRISLELHKNLQRYQTKKNDVLLTIVGNSIGDVGFVQFNIEKCNLTENASKITNIHKVSPATTFVYFLSKFGQHQIRREKVGTAQPKLALDRIRRFKIAKFEDLFQIQLDKLVKEAYQKQQLSKKLYREAEELLLHELGLMGYRPKHRLSFTASKSEVNKAKRFDAEYFQPKYAEIIERIKNYAGGYETVENVIRIKDNNFSPKKELEYNYIALADISNAGYVQSFETALGGDLPTRARRQVKKGDVIISSIEGSLQSCALIEDEFDNALCSTGFYVLESAIINPESLLVLFKSLPIQMQLKRGCKGTILTAIPKDELEKIKIPLIDQQIQKQIAEKIKESHKLRKESKSLLEKAKKMVEDEIEKSDN